MTTPKAASNAVVQHFFPSKHDEDVVDSLVDAFLGSRKEAVHPSTTSDRGSKSKQRLHKELRDVMFICPFADAVNISGS